MRKIGDEKHLIGHNFVCVKYGEDAGTRGVFMYTAKFGKKGKLVEFKDLFIFDIAASQLVINLLFNLIIVEWFLKRFKTWMESLKCWNVNGFELKEALLLPSVITYIIWDIERYS